MKKHQKTDGIILRKIDLGEADQIITVLTKDYGKIALMAQGAKRLKSKFTGHLELLNTVRFSYFQGRSLGYMNDIESLHAIEDKALNLKSRGLLFYTAEATHKLVAEDQECTTVFEYLKRSLELIENQHAEVLFYTYMFKLLTELGFIGAWDHCRHRDQKIDLSIPYYLSLEDAGLSALNQAKETDLKLSPSIIKWVNYIQKNPLQNCLKINPAPSERTEIFFVLKSILETLLNQPFKSESFLKSLH